MRYTRTTSQRCLAILLLLPLTSLAEDLEEGEEAPNTHSRMTGISSHWTPDHWTLTATYEDLRGYTEPPDDLNSLPISVEWQKPELDALGNMCRVRGRLLTLGDEKLAARPVTWFQGVTLYLSKEPGRKLDWSKGMNQDDTSSDTGVVSPTGDFSLMIDARKGKHNRKQSEPFQFGLALAQYRDQTMTWESRSPAIPNSVEMLTIPAAVDLPRELELINNTSGWPFHHPNTVSLIRTVNALHGLGKEEALHTLDKYLELTNSEAYFDEREIVFWIIRLLFEPSHPDTRVPVPMIAVYLLDEDSTYAAFWPINPMVITQDIPFMIGRRISMGGFPEQPTSHVEWARQIGKLRAAPLTPKEHPLLAAQKLFGSLRFRLLDEYERDSATRIVRAQSLAMVEELIPPNEKRDPFEIVDDFEWQAKLQKSVELNIHWDQKRQDFVIGGK